MMDFSCESMRFAEDRRPSSCKLVELHVLCVPGDQWNMKLNKVPAEATESFISAGFIRVYPDVTLKALRGELGALLGVDRSADKFSFLKCVGRSLAVVKSKQERDLKVKTFAPPYVRQASQPELYLLPAVENDSSVCSQSLSPDTSSGSPDHHVYYAPPKMCSLPMGTKGPVKFPHIAQCSQQPPPTPRLEGEEEEEEEEEEEDEDEQSYSSSEGGNEGDALSPVRRGEKGGSLRRRQTQKASQLKTSQQAEADLAQRKELSDKEGTCRNGKRHRRGDGAAEAVEERDSGCSLLDRAGNPKDVHTLNSLTNKHKAGATDHPAGLSRPVRCTSPPPGLHFSSVSRHPAPSPMFPSSAEELMEEIKLVREERKQLEWTRQELLRKGKDLLAQNRHRRNQARDSWKKKYFETKKATAPLEDRLRSLRQELETFYNKLLHQLQARDSRAKPRRQGRSSTKNELIIQIMTETYEVDNLSRKMEDAEMKLVTEIKLRKQAATELRALKAELAQKKSQASGLKGNAERDRPLAQSCSI